jgi:hypothetical protein
VSERGWQREFEDPIPVPDGKRLNTLREAIAYLAKACSTTAKIRHGRSLAWIFGRDGLSLGRAVLVAHECIVSIDLAGKPRPTLGEISQNLGLSFILY